MIESKWFETKEYHIAYSILINAAQHQGLATYQEIAQAVGLPTSGNYMGSVIGEILGIISANEKAKGRPMLSAVAVGTSGKPGDGFVNWAKDIGYLQVEDSGDGFWEQECKKVYAAWKPTYRISHKKQG